MRAACSAGWRSAVLWEVGGQPCRAPRRGKKAGGMFKIQYLEERSRGNFHSETMTGRYAECYHMHKQSIHRRNVIGRDSLDQKYESTKQFSHQKACHFRVSQNGAFWGTTAELEPASQLSKDFFNI